MTEHNRLQPSLTRDRSILAFRDKSYMVLGLATIPFLIPFSINSFLQARELMGVLTACITLLAAANAFSLHKYQHQLVPYWLVYTVIMLAFAIGIATVGTMVAFWCYPVAVVTLFVCKTNQAKWMIFASLLVLIPVALLYMDIRFASRFVITYTMTCYFGILVLNLLERLQQQQIKLSITDPLTGAFNRRHLADCFDLAAEEQQRGLGSFSFVSLDIDHFKAINDLHGHNTGDQVLVAIVNLIKEHVRKIDSVFRLGGEEFTILARGITIEQARDLAEKLRIEIENADILARRKVTASFGLVQYQPGEDLHTCLDRADINLYKAKQAGRNQVVPKP